MSAEKNGPALPTQDAQTLLEEAEAIEREIEIQSYLEDEMTPEERRAFEAKLQNEPDLAAEIEIHQNMLGALQGLKHTVASEDFLTELEGKINTRSRNKFFRKEPFFYSSRVPYEVFAGLMLVVMAALYFFVTPPDPVIDQNLAMSGEPEEKALPPNNTPSKNTNNRGTSSTSTDKPTPVAPLRAETIVYNLTLPAKGDPAVAATGFAKRVKATSRDFLVQTQQPGKLSVTMPRGQLNSFLEAFRKEGKLTQTRAHVGKPRDLQKTTVFVRFRDP